MGSFEDVFTTQSSINEKLEQLMGTLYTKVEEDPDDEFSRYMIGALRDIEISIIDCQRELTGSYCPSEYKETVIAGLDEKENALVKLTSSREL